MMMSFTSSFIFAYIGYGLVSSSVSFEVFQEKVISNASELIILSITPQRFGWELQGDASNQIEYNARISLSPDLPPWIHYTYDAPNSVGFLYGSPPLNRNSIDLDIIAWNRHHSYEVRKLIISMDIIQKPKYDYIVELKIDNMNVKNLCVPRRMKRLLNVFSNYLDWTQLNGSPVTPVYMASAVQLGENQVPVRPNEAEGVVIHLGSNKNVSAGLERLQSEVLPLWKLRPCPRDLKRTSMEKYFRGQGFLVDWCSFKLSLHPTVSAPNSEENSAGPEVKEPEESDRAGRVKDGDVVFHFKTIIPERSYGVGILLATLVPGTIGALVGFLLIALLWSDRDEATIVDGDALFFEAAFRMLKSLYSCRKVNGNGDTGTSHKQGAYHHYRPPSEEEDFVMLTGDDERFVAAPDDRELISTPLPPQYGATHPNGSPALTYAV